MNLGFDELKLKEKDLIGYDTDIYYSTRDESIQGIVVSNEYPMMALQRGYYQITNYFGSKPFYKKQIFRKKNFLKYKSL